MISSDSAVLYDIPVVNLPFVVVAGHAAQFVYARTLLPYV